MNRTAARLRRDAVNKANGVITRHLQPFDGGPCACGWSENGTSGVSHQAHVAEQLWEAGCLADRAALTR